MKMNMVFLLLLASSLFGQDITHKLSIELLGGSSVSTISVFDEDDMNIIGFNGTFRFMWEPEKLLRLGIEGGFLHLAHSKEENIVTEFGMTKRSNSLNAYPLMIHFNMKIWELEIMLALGAAYISSKINAFNDISESGVVTSFKMYGLGYSYSIDERLTVGGEFKYYSFSTLDLTVAAFQLKCKYSIFVW